MIGKTMLDWSGFPGVAAGKNRRNQAGWVPWGLLVLVLAHTTAVAATGSGTWSIMGRVVSSQTGDPLPYATVALFRLAGTADASGTSAGGALTKADGTYRLPAAPGSYRLAVSYVSHRPVKSAVLEIKEGSPPVTRDFALVPDAVQLPTVQVTAAVIRDNEAALLAKQRRAPAISDAVSSQQIAKSTDANAAEVLQRLTGLSVVEGRYVFVRGLGERYSTTQINGASIGTPEPNKRVVPLDLFASGLLDNIVVQKTYTPDQPGEFGGGVVNVSTRDFPGRRITSLSASSAYNARTTGMTFYSYDGGRWDFLGFDDGTRAMPQVVTRLAGDHKIFPRSFITGQGFSADTLALLGRAFSRTWDRKSGRAVPATGISGTYGDEFNVRGRQLGLLGSFSYSAGRETRRSEDNTYLLDPLLKPDTEYHTVSSTTSVLWGAIANTSYRLNDYNSISLRTMYNRSADDVTRYYEGYSWTWNTGLQNTRLDYVERGMFVASVATSSYLSFLGGGTLDLRCNYSRTDRDEPDRREYTYEQVNVAAEPKWLLTTRSTDLGLTRMFGSMQEDARGPEANLTIPFKQWSGLAAKIKAGVAYQNKDRDSHWRRFAYRAPSFAPDKLDSVLALSPGRYMTGEMIAGQVSRGFVISELTKQDTDSYVAHQDVAACYAMADLPLTAKCRATVGARIERADMRVDAYDIFRQLPDSVLAHARLKNTDVLPSVNLTYAIDDATNLRFGVSSTVCRPDFRELSKQNFYEFVDGYPEMGNPSLKRARVHNWDLRAETYPGANSLCAVSVFYKELMSPIENSIVGGSVPTRMPINARSGLLRGFEAEARVGLGSVRRALESFAGTANLTVVKSQTNVSGLGVGTSARPPLQGQSPYVVNLGIYYASAKGETSGAVLYNVFGRRLDRLGIQGQPDIYEQPRHSLDVTVSRSFRVVKAKLAIENLLDGEVRFEQKQPAIPRGDEPASRVVYRSRRGRSISLSISNG
jgi:TonB-dependent receptor